MNSLQSKIYWKNLLDNDSEYCGFKRNFITSGISIESHYVNLEKPLQQSIAKFTNNDHNACKILYSSILGIVLHKHTNSDSFYIGVTIDKNREKTGIMPFKMDFRDSPLRFKDFLNTAQKTYSKSYSLFFSTLSYPALFDTVCNLTQKEEDADTVKLIEEGKCQILFQFFHLSGNIKVFFNTEYIDRLYIESVVRQFIEVLNSCLSDYLLLIQKINPLTKKERYIIENEFNNTTYNHNLNQTLLDLFKNKIKKRIISRISYKDQIITSIELNEHSNKVANFLISQCNVKPGDKIGVLMERSSEMMSAIWGILKSGAIYVPLDVMFPEERTEYIIETANVRIVLSVKKHLRLLNRLLWNKNSLEKYICLDSEHANAEVEEEGNGLMDENLWNHVAISYEDDIQKGGWQNSYNGEPFSIKEMEEYSQNIFNKLAPYLEKSPKILEIGCASGLTTYKISSYSSKYVATDLSTEIINYHINSNKNNSILFEVLPAHEIDKHKNEDFDLVIMNSVVHCFNGHNYFKNVIKKSINCLAETGHIFVGDVLNLDLKNSFLQELINYKANNKNKNIRTKLDWSNELFLSAAFFENLKNEIQEIKNIFITNKEYTIENELTNYRFDVVIEIDKNNIESKEYIQNQFDKENVNSASTEQPIVHIDPTSLAYIIHTSGTTGKPKGVGIRHDSLMNRLLWMQKEFDLKPDETILFKTPFSFDVSVWEIFWWAIAGANVMILSSQKEKYPEVLIQAIEEGKVSILHFVPSMLEAFLDYIIDNNIDKSLLRSIRQVITSGEALKIQHVKKFYKVFSSEKVKLSNLYGPTEATIDVSCFHVPRSLSLDAIPIGKPIDNTELYIVGDNKLLPIGVPGEIFIGGIQLSPGYINNKQLTSEKFIETEFGKSKRYYKTGDLARWLPDGNIEFLGRLDSQVKIRGFRIELEEVTTCLNSFYHIKNSVVIAKEVNGVNVLVAYYIPKEVFVLNELKEHLASQLPDYMLPSYFIEIKSIPINEHGKIDVKKLAENVNSKSTESKQPTNAIEHTLQNLYAEVLQQDKKELGINKSFFELGGHSLSAINLISKINSQFDIKLNIEDIFKYPSIEGLSDIVSAQDKERPILIEKCKKKDYYQLISVQRRLYFLYQYEPNSVAYNIPCFLKIKGKLNSRKIEESFKTIINRHEALRTIIQVQDGIPVQCILSEVNFSVEHYEWDTKSLNEVTSSFIRPFDLGIAPCFRVGLVSLSELEHLLMFDINHINCDLASIEIIINEFFHLYEGKRELPDVKYQYKDYSEWINNREDKQLLEGQKQFWLNMFNDNIPVLELPLDKIRPSRQDFTGKSLSFQLDREVVLKLRKLASESNVTMYSLFITIFSIFLNKISNQNDIVIGSPVTIRNIPEFQKVIGNFFNTIALRTKIINSETFVQLLLRTHELITKALKNFQYPFEDLINQLNIERDFSRNPLFDVMLLYKNTSHIYNFLQEVENLYITPVNYVNRTSKFDLSLHINENNETINLSFEYATSLLEDSTIERFINYFMVLINNIIQCGTLEIKEYSIIDRDELNTLVNEFNNTKLPVPKYGNVCQLLMLQVDESHDHIAVKTDDTSQTYGEFNVRTNKLANFLMIYGVKPRIPVVLFLKRTHLMIEGIFGVLKTGAYYIPIDTDYPDHRILTILNDTKSEFILTDCAEKLVDLHGNMQIINILDKNIILQNSNNIIPDINSTDLIYTIYTSGSTGKPKGVEIKHGNVINLIYGLDQIFHYKSVSKTLSLASYAFDMSIPELIVPLCKGMQVIIGTKEHQNDIGKYISLLEENKIDVLQILPSRLSALYEVDKTLNSLKNVKLLIVGAEPFPLDLFLKIKEIYTGLLFNIYGPTETTVWSTCCFLNRLNEVVIGKPIANTKVYVLNEFLHICPLNVEGELYISGEGLARGYTNIELTTECFVNNPFIPGTRMYKTGDIVKWLPSGNLKFIRRIDNQVKIRGYRIELDEIEYNIKKNDFINNAVVKLFGEGTNKKLVAYCTSSNKINSDILKKELEKKLPGYMIPDYYIQIDALPLNINGKIDRKALSGTFNLKTDKKLLPASELEEKVAMLISEVLHVDIQKISMSDNIHELGFNSITIMILVEKIRMSFNIGITIRNLFETTSILELVKIIEQSIDVSDKTKRQQIKI
jgi:fengycin family lipopeptide synthetase D